MQNDHKVPFLGHRTATYRHNSKNKTKHKKTGEYSYCYRKTTQRKPLNRMPFSLRNVYSAKLRKRKTAYKGSKCTDGNSPEFCYNYHLFFNGILSLQNQDK